MDWDSSEKFSLDNSNLHELDGSTAEEIDLSLEVNKGREVYGSEKEPWGDRIQADLIHQPPGSSLLPAVIRNKELESLYNRSSSPAHCELYNNNERTEDTVLKEERMNSYQGDETGDNSGRHEDKPSSPVQAANIQPELEMEDPDRFSSKFPLEMYSNNLLENTKEISPHHDVTVKSNDEFPGSFQQERTKIAHEEEEDNMQLMKKEYCDSGILMEDKNFSESVLNNGETGQTSSPKKSHDLPSCPQDSPYSTRSPRHRTLLSPQRISGDSRRVFSEDDLSLSPRHMPPSPTRRPQRVSPRRDEALQKHLTSPPRRRQISPDHRRPDRSVSRSPTGQRAHGRESPSPTRRPRRESIHKDEALQKHLSSPPRRRQISPDHRRSVSRSPTGQRAHGSESPSPTRRPRRESLHRDEALQKRLSSPPRRRQISPDHRRSDRSVSRSPTGQRAHGRESPSPTRRPRRESLHRNGALQKRLSSPPRRRQFSPDHQRPDRSVSRSPTGQRAHGSRRDHHVRSRSRSPFARDYYRRSPRRYSPRRRSPPRYHSRRHTPRRRPWSPPHDRDNGIGRPGNNLFVAGFSFVTTERDLERKFSRFGRVRDVRIVRDKRSGDSRGFGFLSVERDEDADAAIRALDQTEWDGRVVLVEKSKTP